MKAFKTLLMLGLVVGVVAGARSLGLISMQHGDQRSVATTRPVVRQHHAPAPSAPTASATASPAPVTSEPTVPPAPTPTPTRTPTAAADRVVLRAGDTGTKVRELQARLSQLAWLPETTTGTYDAVTRVAVRGFQGKRGLPASGTLDHRTWRRLAAMTRRPTHDQLFNVFHSGPAILASGAVGDGVRDLQARLQDLDWYVGDVTGRYGRRTVTAVKGFQAKRRIPVTGEVDRRTIDRLRSMTMTPTHDAMHNIVPSPGALDPRCMTGRVLCIDKTSRTLRWVVHGTVRLTLDARFGSTLNDTPTREGLFHVYLMDADHVSQLFGSAMPYSMFFSGGQAVHYSSDFATYGYYGASHGCVNIRDYDGVKWLFSHVHVGDAVVVYWS